MPQQTPAPLPEIASRAPTAASRLSPPGSRRQRLGLAAGPAVALIVLLTPTPDGLETVAWRTAAVGLWMAIWWMSEALPIAATSLLPMVAFPVLGIAPIRDAAAPFANPLIFLFLGGFLIALALEEVGLHRRIALAILGAIGSSRKRVILGFMLASAGLSLWISNTATAMMMMPIALSVITQLPRPGSSQDPDDDRFGVALLLGVAYACSLGGTATLIGTPTNALLAAYLLETYQHEISFVAWMGVAVPIAAIGLALVYVALTRSLPAGSAVAPDTFAAQRRDLGPMDAAERRVGLIFLLTAGLWLSRTQLDNFVPGLSDTGIALFGALLLFSWPLRRAPATAGKTDAGEPLGVLDWSSTRRLPWGVLLLFGGGLSLASAIQSTGLAAWIGGGLGQLQNFPVLWISLATVAIVVFLTELTSNTATTAAFLPVLAALSIGLGQDPLLLLVPATIAASCAFMLPVATPPNAIVYGTGHVTLPQMARAGWRLNLLFIPLVTLLCYGLLTAVLGVQSGVLPPWASP